MRWSVGEATIQALINDGKLKRRRNFDQDMNQTAFDKLNTKLTSVDLLISSGDYDTTIAVCHEIIRKTLTCLLRAQGLDIGDVTGSHKTIEEAALAQFAEPSGPLHQVRYEIQDIRLRRHESEYQSALTEISANEAETARETALAVKTTAGKLMPHLSVF